MARPVREVVVGSLFGQTKSLRTAPIRLSHEPEGFDQPVGCGRLYRRCSGIGRVLYEGDDPPTSRGTLQQSVFYCLWT